MYHGRKKEGIKKEQDRNCAHLYQEILIVILYVYVCTVPSIWKPNNCTIYHTCLGVPVKTRNQHPHIHWCRRTETGEGGGETERDRDKQRDRKRDRERDRERQIDR